MSTNRLERRTKILRGKRNGCFDRNQYYLEAANRARVARKVRCRIRQMEPVVLETPRWSSPERFLDDLAGDLAVGSPEIYARSLSVTPLRGRDRGYAMTWLATGVRDFVGIAEPVRQAVGRRGFQHQLLSYFMEADRGPLRALLIHGLETLGNELTQDLVLAYQEFLDQRAGERRSFVLLLASSAGAASLQVSGSEGQVGRELAEVIVLPDYGGREAVEALVEYSGSASQASLEAAAEISGGIPAVLEAMGGAVAQSGRLADPTELMRTLGPVGAEIRRAAAIIAADVQLADRLERLAREGALPPDPKTDAALGRAGLVEAGADGAMRLRAPFLAELAMVD